MLAPNGAVTPVSRSVANGRTASCWLSVTPDQRYVYVSNTEDGTISSYSVDAMSGRLTVLQGTAHSESAMGAPASGPVDAAISMDGRYLYQLYSGLGRIGVYRIGNNGQLTALPEASATELPHVGAEGLAGF
jgi:6-phosphogluconolactonase (cycloisomerase 2 family)